MIVFRQLEALQPAFIILYNMDMVTLRQIEVGMGEGRGGKGKDNQSSVMSLVVSRVRERTSRKQMQ